MQITQGVSIDTENAWSKILTTSANPLGLTQEIVEESIKVCPPIEFKGGTWLGRFLVPDIFVRYNPEEQPRDKSNDSEHVNNLVNSFEVQQYLITSQPPVASFDDQTVDPHHLTGQSGFNRKEARERIGQEIYIYDVYSWDSKYDEVVARNQTNHHNSPHLSQTKHDYLKEVNNAIRANIITADSDSIDEFVDKIATDKTAKVRRWIKKEAYNNNAIYPNFRTYNSIGSGKNTLHGFFKSYGIAKTGIEGRNVEEQQEQGYISYFASNGDNLQAWARGISHGTNRNVPVWLFGYAPNRVPDLTEWREDYITKFNIMKTTFITFSQNLINEGESCEYDEDTFPVKLAGFLPQYVKPNPNDKGKPTESGLVDTFGNAIRFDCDGDCLTITQG
tara:strand:+ start:329 stop:1498 length:1170 start_codon:yes stop_codon:yes gene_type:complete